MSCNCYGDQNSTSGHTPECSIGKPTPKQSGPYRVEKLGAFWMVTNGSHSVIGLQERDGASQVSAGINQAVARERERCARIARSCSYDDAGNMSEIIAKAIERGDEA